MHEKRLIFLLYMCATVSVSLAFNIDVTSPEIYNGTAEDFFGFKVLQVESKGNKGIIVTAPLFMNGTGAVYRHGQNKETFTKQFHLVEEEKLSVKHLGLSIAKDPTNPVLTVCSPNVVTRCNENSYMNSVCYNLEDNNLQEQSQFEPAFQGCTKKIVNLAFLFDGSASMTPAEFKSNKDFIADIMTNLKNTSIKFSAIQFSAEVRTVFTFNDYTNGNANRLLESEVQYRSLTNTHKALQFVLKNHFENNATGASPEATKVLVLITDGDPSDTDRKYNSIKEYNSKNIIRLVIGVKNVTLSKFKTIASGPNNTFYIENYNGLTGVLENFQKKIFQAEGTTATLADDLTEEMSQTGLSVAYANDALLMGSVGSNTWRGSLHELRGKTETQIKDPDMKKESYMGYSVSVGEKNKNALYFTGAPRYNHVGQVLLFSSTGGRWTLVERITGEQHGSYFGGDLCSVDVESDGNTDFLLVGAPLFYQPHESREGKIYVYKLTDKLKLSKLLDITALIMGRFGTTITSVADLNGDGLQDVAVGAPLEEENTGAVYLYLGDRSTGIRSTHSQRILGKKCRSGLKFFGQSIDGSIDLGNDGLPDLLIGSRGAAVVLKSKPVFNITTHITFEPHEIKTNKIKCPSPGESIPLVTLKICFEMTETTKRSAGAVEPIIKLSNTLEFDPERQSFRGFVNSTTKRRNHTETYEMKEGNTCFNRSVFMHKCVMDIRSPIRISMSFSQVESDGANAVLNSDSCKNTTVEVPFERRCRNNTCIAKIEVDFKFLSPKLLVGDNNYFNMSVTLFNRGEDSYNTNLMIHHSPGLSFSSINLETDSKTKPPFVWNDYKDKLSVDVSHPVYYGASETKFLSIFRVVKQFEWDEVLSVNITGHSDNQNSSKGLLTQDIPVQYEIKMTLSTEDSVTYMNFTTEDYTPKKLVSVYKVHNHGWKSFPVNVTLFFPTKLENNFEMNNYQVQVEKNTTQCREMDGVSTVEAEYCTPERHCKYIVCDTFLLNNGTGVEFELSGDVKFKDLGELNPPFLKRYTGGDDNVEYESFLFVSYDKQKYTLDSGNEESKSEEPDERRLWDDDDPSMESNKVQIERIILPDKMLIILTGAGGGLLLLIIIAVIMVKLGCFKRKLHDMVQEEEGADETGALNGVSKYPDEEKGNDDIAGEKKMLMEKQENTSDDAKTEME